VGSPARGQPLCSVVALGTATRWEHVVMGAPVRKPRDEWPPGTIGSMLGTVGDRVPTVGQIVACNIRVQRLRMQSENHRKN
jgi:hypothetical protein